MRANRMKWDHFGWTSDSEGITVNGVKGRQIPYREIKSIFYDSSKIKFVTREGEEIILKNSLGLDIEPLYKAIKQYNLEYVDLDEADVNDELFTIDEVNIMAEATKEYVYDLVSAPVKERYGDEYDIELELDEAENYMVLCFCLTKAGEKVQFYESFDDLTIAFLVKWESSLGYGKYGVAVEVTDRAACDKAVQDVLDYLFEKYQG